MNPQQEDELVREIAALRRETRSLRRWVIFTAICVGTILFAPQLAVFIAANSARLFEFSGNIEGAMSIVAVLIVFVGGAVIVSRNSSSNPERTKGRANKA